MNKITLDELMQRIRAEDPGVLGPRPGAAQQRLILATLQAAGRAASEAGQKPLALPGLGSFRRKLRPGAGEDAAPRILFVPEDPAAGPAPAAAPAVQVSVAPLPAADRPTAPRKRAALDPWQRALKASEMPLVDPLGRFVVLFSAKSACSTVVIWFLHVLGLAQEARAHSNWPHDYRIDKFYKRPDYLAARASIRPDTVKVLRVVRDPVDRAGSSFRHALGFNYARESIQQRLGVDIVASGLSFERFIDFLELEDLDHCNPHHRRQKHPLEAVRALTRSSMPAGKICSPA